MHLINGWLLMIKVRSMVKDVCMCVCVCVLRLNEGMRPNGKRRREKAQISPTHRRQVDDDDLSLKGDVCGERESKTEYLGKERGRSFMILMLNCLLEKSIK